MKTEKNILIAFLLNLSFSLLELIGGLFTNSVAILSDAIHDFGDALSIGISWGLERKSRKQPDDRFTYGYGRYSVIGSVITTLVLVFGSGMVMLHAVERMFAPQPVHSGGMLVLAVIGLGVNLAAAFVTREGDSLNRKAVNLHMLEDVLGWAVVLVGAVIMHLTGWSIIDPLLSAALAVYILIHAVGHLKESLALFLEGVPEGVSAAEVRQAVLAVAGVGDVHHVHLWSMDGYRHFATMHLVAQGDAAVIKHEVREALEALHIGHVTLELEHPAEDCHAAHCDGGRGEEACHGHHHHHH